MRSIRTYFALSCGALALLACSPATSETSDVTEASEAPQNNGIVNVEADDAEMNAAKKQGKATLPQFFAQLENPAPDEQNFAVKFDLSPDRDPEFIWASDLRRKDGKLTGKLSNVPLDERYSAGQQVEIDEDLIIDWGYYKGDVMQGHYTTRVILNQLPEEEAAQIRAALGW